MKCATEGCEHEATIDFSDSLASYMHGWVEKICLCCYVKRIEQEHKAITGNLAKYREELEKIGCA